MPTRTVLAFVYTVLNVKSLLFLQGKKNLAINITFFDA